MRIVDILSEDLIVPDLRATTKTGVIEEVCAHVSRVRPLVPFERAVTILLDRERLGSTGVGQGFAIPHGKLAELEGVIACFARSTRGVAFDSLDGNPAYLFFTLLAPQGAAGLHLKALARASRLFKEESFRNALIGEVDSTKLFQIIEAQDESLSRAIERG